MSDETISRIIIYPVVFAPIALAIALAAKIMIG